MLDNDELYNLIARCALRDQKALEDLYRKTAPYLNKVAYNILKSEDLSNDALQEGFVQIWQNAGDYRPDKAKAITWVTSIIRYRALDHLAKEKRHRDQIEQNTDEIDHLDNVESDSRPDIEAMDSQKDQLLAECMDTLNERTKTSIRMAYLEGFSRDDIAAKFNTSANTVKSWLHRGSDRLKQCIEFKTEAQS